MRVAPPLVVAMLVALSVVRAEADETVVAPPTAMLELHLAPDVGACPSEAVIRRTVAAHLGWDPFRPDADLRIVAVLGRGGTGLVARVQAFESDGTSVGERAFESATNDCAELARAMALAISVAVDPFVLARTGGDAPPLETEPAVEPAPVTEAPVTSAPEEAPPPEPITARPAAAPEMRTRPPERSGPVLGGMVGVGLGVVPSVRPYVGAFAETRRARFRASLAFRYDTPATVEGPSGGRARAQQLEARLAGCFAPRRVRACGSGSVGVLLAAGEDVATARRGNALVPRLGVSFGYELGTAALVVRPTLSVDVALARPELRLNLESAYRVPAVAGALGLVVAWQSP